jgi:hypothetical protein
MAGIENSALIKEKKDDFVKPISTAHNKQAYKSPHKLSKQSQIALYIFSVPLLSKAYLAQKSALSDSFFETPF